MPFTLSHAAAILPIHAWSKSRLPLAALAIGSMSPDFAYFLPYDLGRTSHTVVGIFVFCWPLGMTAWLVFEHLLKEPTIALLSGVARKNTSENLLNPGRTFVLVSIALVIGAFTHIVWDACTHVTSPLVAALPTLRAVAFEFRGRPVPVYKVLQHLSTIVGLVAIAVWIVNRWESFRDLNSVSDRGHSSHPVSMGWRVGAFAAVSFVSLVGAVSDWLLHPGSSIERQFFHLAIGGMLGLALSWCGVAIAARAFGSAKL